MHYPSIILIIIFVNLYFLSCQNLPNKKNDPEVSYPKENQTNFQTMQLDFSDQGIYNLPVFMAVITAKHYRHAVNCIFTGDSIMNYRHWTFFDSQNDYFFPAGKPNIPNSIISIYSGDVTSFDQKNKRIEITQTAIMNFYISKDGVCTRYSPHDFLLDENMIDKLWTGTEVTNPYFQPHNRTNGIITYDYYGSGDVDGNNIIDWKDYERIQDTKNYRSDVNGDGQLSNREDVILLKRYLTDEIPYLPAHWNYLQTYEERLYWVKRVTAIDDSDRKTYHIN